MRQDVLCEQIELKNGRQKQPWKVKTCTAPKCSVFNNFKSLFRCEVAYLAPANCQWGGQQANSPKKLDLNYTAKSPLFMSSHKQSHFYLIQMISVPMLKQAGEVVGANLQTGVGFCSQQNIDCIIYIIYSVYSDQIWFIFRNVWLLQAIALHALDDAQVQNVLNYIALLNLITSSTPSLKCVTFNPSSG